MLGTRASLPWVFFMWVEALILQTLYRLLPLQRRSPDQEESVHGRVVVVTGAGSGIGRWVATEMARRGARVVMAVRNISQKARIREEILQESGASPSSISLVEVDLGSMASVRACATTLLTSHPVIDILINNGGISLNSSKRGCTQDGFEQHMGVNHLSHYLLTRLLLPGLRKSSFGGGGARVVTVSSSGLMQANLSLQDFFCERSWRGFGYTMHYSNSKLANCLFAKELDRREKLVGVGGSGVKSFGICPGFVKDTAILRNYEGRRFAESFMSLIGVDLEKGCDMIMYCALGKEAAQYSGKLFRFGRRFWTAEALLEDNFARDVWSHSEQLVGLGGE